MATADLLFLKMEVSCEEADGLEKLRVVPADLSDGVSHYLHHRCGDGVRTGLQAAVLSQQTADVHGVQEHLLAVLGWRERDRTSQQGCPGCSQETRKGPTLVEVVVGSMHHV